MILLGESIEIVMKDSSKNILISVVVPIYNVEKYLDRCIESILNQTYVNLEILLINDGSTDNSPAICNKYKNSDTRIKVIHKENGGLSDARNTGIRVSRGDYITFIDSDDNVEVDMIEYLLSLIKKYNTKMSVCSHNVVFKEGKIIKSLGNDKKEEVLSAKDCIKKMLYHKDIDTSAWAKLYHISLFKNIRYPKGKLFEDIGTTYRFFLESKFVACGYRSKYNYYVRENSIVTQNFSIKKLDLLEMTDQMGNDVLKIFPDLKKAVLRRRVYARFSTLNQMLEITDYKEEKKEIILFIKSNGYKILLDCLVPIRDKVAVILLYISKQLYKFIWERMKK